MIDNNLEDLHPDLKPLAEKWLSSYSATGRKAVITQTFRTPKEQADIYAAGHSNAPEGKSKHELTLDGKPASQAFDFALYDEDGEYISDGTDDWYADAGRIGKELGLKWGGDFKTVPDYDHLELPDNFNKGD